MKCNEIIQYCCNKNRAYIDYPFGDAPICIKINKKIFAQIYPLKNDYKITLKCDAVLGDFYRQHYPGVVVRGYHCPPVQQPYWNTVYIDKISENELLIMIDQAYDTVIKSFPKKVQKLLAEKEDEPFNMTIKISDEKLIPVLDNIFRKRANERICVVGTTCCGKSYLTNKLDNCRDMDKEIFRLLNEDETKIVCQTPWTSEIGKIMDGYVKEKIKTRPNEPVFATVPIESDIIIYLNINDELLKEHCKKRGVKLKEALEMKKSIEDELYLVKEKVIEICF
ncbi:MmcQ/YjbR family DNA-binding protein [Clostridium hydrogenum]|uniref:MmcQ/YjbR family DNA-binding protein n=1 Tax=Clostridium hydrogenum TaxID=2855764 RepID=UPI001F21AFEF|nr:MmcQ/YjbR family DNA-binding protein [Clostridium hydrogenum]